MRVTISLACSVCTARNYRTTRAQRPGEPPLVMKKFCKACNQHTPHRESK